MTDEKSQEEKFWSMADKFIHLANDQMESSTPGEVSAALLYAAARFNAFIVASTPEVNITEEKQGALKFYVDQYREMFTENIDHYEKNPLS